MVTDIMSEYLNEYMCGQKNKKPAGTGLQAFA